MRSHHYLRVSELLTADISCRRESITVEVWPSEVIHAPVDGSTHVHIQATVLGLRGL